MTSSTDTIGDLDTEGATVSLIQYHNTTHHILRLTCMSLVQIIFDKNLHGLLPVRNKGLNSSSSMAQDL
ncbi:hypothetical protein E2C01_002268 [Portunus trituberculatus]|uniref:Uncharacterized protein n=1 Tax=Portunus trituberculatus TaxID=210409 RepID=A0A5B7CQ95_PORTR|nr:hypothetical protein [Portunus trituberculatus]